MKILIFLSLVSVQAFSAVRVVYKVDLSSRTLISARQFSGVVDGKQLLRKIPYYIGEGLSGIRSPMMEEYLLPDTMIDIEIQQKLLKNQFLNLPKAEFREIVVQGPKENRINLTILGDGYTESEKEKFFADAKRTTEGLFVGKTFASYLPLFNVYAVFVPSNQSGIGDGKPKDTAFKLYRDPPGSKRAIMPGNEAALEEALLSAPATDYPIVIANDNFYGGLGGRFAISTSSERSGLVVLRHELGHNFGEVGEEYDNGSVYRGANSSSTANVPWKQWVSGNLSVNESVIISGNYVWQNLIKPYNASFTIPAGMDLLFMSLSSVGWDTDKDVQVLLNDKDLPMVGKFHEDRAFYELKPTPVKSGQKYNLQIRQNIADGNNVLGFAVAFAAPASYDFTPDKVGAFATFSTYGVKSYRPTHSQCIMRNMESESFCSVDQENMWLKFLGRIKLIDSISTADGNVLLETQKLDGLEVSWFQLKGTQETELAQFANETNWSSSGFSGSFRVKVKFSSPEIRLKSPRLIQTMDFKL
jgi:hypothetical protein